MAPFRVNLETRDTKPIEEMTFRTLWGAWPQMHAEAEPLAGFRAAWDSPASREVQVGTTLD